MCRMHPHHQGSSSLMMQTCSVPVVLDENPSGGFDYLSTPSCAPFQQFFTPENEIIMHMQVSRNISCHRQSPVPLAKAVVELSFRMDSSCMQALSVDQ